VLYSDNNLGWFQRRLAGFWVPSLEQTDHGPVKGLAESTACAEPEIPSRSQRYPEHKKGRSDERCGLKQNPR
jgi:hypothetical protein